MSQNIPNTKKNHSKSKCPLPLPLDSPEVPGNGGPLPFPLGNAGIAGPFLREMAWGINKSLLSGCKSVGKPWGRITTKWLYNDCEKWIDLDKLFSNVTQQKCHFLKILKHGFMKVPGVRNLWCQKELECLQVYPSSSPSLNSASKCDSAISMEIYGNVHFFLCHCWWQPWNATSLAICCHGTRFSLSLCQPSHNLLTEVWCILNWNPPVSGYRINGMQHNMHTAYVFLMNHAETRYFNYVSKRWTSIVSRHSFIHAFIHWTHTNSFFQTIPPSGLCFLYPTDPCHCPSPLPCWKQPRGKPRPPRAQRRFWVATRWKWTHKGTIFCRREILPHISL